MHSFVRRSGILIPKLYEKEDFYQKIKMKLTRTTKDFHNEEYTTNIFYVENNKFLMIPRFFPIQDFVQCKIVNKSCSGLDIDIEHNIIPRDQIQWNGINYLLNNDSGIVKLSPGVGKTVLAIYTICKLKKKSIIFVHRKHLLEQWIERFLEHTNLKKEDIGILSTKKYQEEFQKPIILSTVQTFRSILMKQSNFIYHLNKANIGISFHDENHTSTGAPKFSLSAMFIPCRRTYGLSATPERGDGNTDILNYHLGSIFEQKSSSKTMKPKVTILVMNFGITSAKTMKWICWGGTFNRSRYLKILHKSEILKFLTVQFINRFHKNKRKILVVIERLNLIDEIFEKLNKVENKVKFVAGVGFEVISKNDVILSTSGKCRDGLDEDSLNTLIITSPISNMEQLGGRINRWKVGKAGPLIIDMVDFGCHKIAKTVYSRIDFYKLKGWDIQYTYLNSKNTMVKMEEKDLHKLIEKDN